MAVEHDIAIDMKLTETFIMISKKIFGLHGLYKNISALWGSTPAFSLSSQTGDTVERG